MVDGFGSPDLSPQYVRELTEAGVRFRIFDAGSGILGRRLKMLRRMHRKIIVVDGSLAFIGGINFSADHLGDFGPEAKQDYAVAIQGPVVEDILHFANAAIADADGVGRSWFQPRPTVRPSPKQPNFGGTIPPSSNASVSMIKGSGMTRPPVCARDALQASFQVCEHLKDRGEQ